MSRRRMTGTNVLDAAYERIASLYKHGDHVVVSTSGGKDSTVVMELTIMVARDLGELPVTVVMRDEEIMYPGTFEYLRRVAERTDEVDFHWMIAGQPIVNAFNREAPYWWVFDPLEEERWVRSYPGHGDEPQLPGRPAYWIPEGNIEAISGLQHHPMRGRRGWEDWDELTHDERVARARREGRDTDIARHVSLTGLRVEESRVRMMGLLSSGNFLTKRPAASGGFMTRPCYDWQVGHVWRFIREYDLDYNNAYDVMTRAGIPARRQRIAPPTLNPDSLDMLAFARSSWPRWWQQVTARVGGGLNSAAQFGKRAVQPLKESGETWESYVERELLNRNLTPDWIVDRVEMAVAKVTQAHSRHSSGPLPDSVNCQGCQAPLQCWRAIANNLYNGDPFAMKSELPVIEPEFFRPGAGTFGGNPNFA